ncbi:MAG: DUF1579 family protein [bacterium]
MYARLILLFVLMAIFTLPLLAQQKDVPPSEKGSGPALQPLEDALWASLVGEWRGWSEDAAGRSEDEMEVEWELHKQFLRTKVTAKVQGMEYKLVGYATKDQATGAITSHWFDTFRGVYRGTEARSGNKFTLKMEGPATVERTCELIDNNKLVGTYKVVQPNGQVVEGKFELLRKVKAPKKS